MPDPNDAPEPIEQTLEEEVKTNRALERGLGVGARELAAIHESGAEGTLERAVDEDGEPVEEQVEVGDAGRSASGPSGSSSQRGTCHTMPGSEIGMQLPVLIKPALPNDAPLPAPVASSRLTRRPARCSDRAVQRPTMPAPITVTSALKLESELESGGEKERGMGKVRDLYVPILPSAFSERQFDLLIGYFQT